MPLYEYQCDSCGHRFEVIQKFSDDPLTACPKCQGAVRKLLSSPAIQFKGSGWYITDYAKKNSPGPGSAKTESADASAKPSTASGTESTSSTPSTTATKPTGTPS